MKKAKRIIALLFSLIFTLSALSIVTPVYAGLAETGYYLRADFETEETTPRFQKIEGSEPSWSINEEENGNRYIQVSGNASSWTNWGFYLDEPLPKQSPIQLHMEFDFKANGMSYGYGGAFSLMDSTKISGENVYHQFGLLYKSQNSETFSVAGKEIPNVPYVADKWYHYDMTFATSGNVNVTITDKENPEISGNYTGSVAGNGTYGKSMQTNDRAYNSFRIGLNCTVSIDNLIIEEDRSNPIAIKELKTAHVGNIFDDKDEQKFEIKLQNALVDPVKAELSYIAVDEDGIVGDQGVIGTYDFAAREFKDLEVITNVPRYGMYDLFIDAKVTMPSGEVVEARSNNRMFSVVNKLEPGDKVNPLTAVNNEYVRKPEDWTAYEELMLQAGISGARKDYTWYDTDSLDLPEYEHKLSYLYDYYPRIAATDIENMAILMGSNPKYTPAGDWSTTEYSLWNNDNEYFWDAWRRHIEWSVKTYGQYVDYWEILNEPTEKCSVEQYARVCKLANQTIKKMDPNATVVGFCTASMPWAWIEGNLAIMMDNPKDYLDIVSIHPYDFAYDAQWATTVPGMSWSISLRDQTLLDKRARMRELMDKYGFQDIPLIETEIAVTSTPGVSSLKKVGTEIGPLFAMTEAQDISQQIYWYCFENTQPRGSQYYTPLMTEWNFGMVGYRGDDVPYAAKSSYIALCAYNEMVGEAEYIDGIQIDDWSRILRFKRKSDGQQVIVLWSEMSWQNVALDLGCSEVEVYDMYSNLEGVMKPTQGAFQFTTTQECIYLVGDFKKLERVDNIIGVEKGLINAVYDDNATYKYFDKLGRNLRVEATGTHMAEITNYTDVVAGKGQVSIHTGDDPVVIDEMEPTKIAIYEGDDMVYYGKYYTHIGTKGVTITHSLGLDPAGSGRNVVNLNVENKTAGTVLTGDVVADFTKNGGTVEERTIVNLKPGETKTVYLNIPKFTEAKSIRTTAELHFGGKYELAAEMTMIQDFIANYNTTGKYDVSAIEKPLENGFWFGANDALAADFYMKEYKQVWGGPDDCSFKGQFLWDEKNFYIYLEVKDNVHFQEKTWDQTWEGDGLQIGIQYPGVIGEGQAKTENQYHEFGIAKTPEGIQWYTWSIHPSVEMTAGKKYNYDATIDRVGTKTIYRLAVPWSEIIGVETVKEGEEVRFNVIANDNDGAGRRGWMELTSGIGTGKNAQKFAHVYFVK